MPNCFEAASESVAPVVPEAWLGVLGGAMVPLGLLGSADPGFMADPEVKLERGVEYMQLSEVWLPDPKTEAEVSDEH
jgi:hypothetical protein